MDDDNPNGNPNEKPTCRRLIDFGAPSPHIGLPMHHPPGSETTSAVVAAATAVLATAVLATAAATARAGRCVVAAARCIRSGSTRSCGSTTFERPPVSKPDNRNTARNQPYRRPAPQPMRPPMRRQQTTHSAPRMDAPTWYAGDMRRANRPAARGGKRKRQADDSEEEHVVVVPPSCYNGSLPKRRGSMYYCEAHALWESECSVHE